MRARGTVLVVAVSACVVTGVALVWAVVTRDPASVLVQEHGLAVTLMVVSYSVLGALVIRRLPANRLGWLCLAIGVSEAATAVITEYGRYAVVTNPGSLPAGAVVLWVGTWVWFPTFCATMTILVAWFPDGRVHRRWVLVPLAITAVGVGAFVVATAVMAWRVRWTAVDAADQVDDGSGLAMVADAGPVLFLVGAVGCAASVVDRLRRSAGRERQQLWWFACGAILTVAVLSLGSFDWFTAPVAELASRPLLPAAIGVALLRHRLYDIEFVVNRVLLYAALVATIGGLYVGVVASATRWLDAGALPAAVVAAGVVAVGFDRIRRVLERVADRLLFAQRHDPAGAMSELTRRLASATGPEVLDAMAGAIVSTVGLRGARVQLGEDLDGPLVGAAGEVGTPSQELPLVFEGRRVGLLVVAAPAGAPLDRSARRLLDDLAAQAAIAARAVLLAVQLQRSRARLVEAVEQERRRLRRDLHDGVGTSLVGVVMQLEALSNLLDATSPATPLVKTIETETRQAMADTRRLVQGLAPPVVEEMGLVEALRQHADRLNRTGGRRGTFQLQADSDSINGLPAAVQVAAYVITTEAMTNVARHAHASACTVTLAQNSLLHLEVTDDGIGIEPHRRPGVGLQSMRERTEELGGALTIEPARPRGTRVAATLPLELS